MPEAFVEDRLQVLEQRLSVHDARLDINDVLVRYSRALDWLDAALLDSVFSPDATIDYGFFKGSWADFRPLLIEMEHGLGRRWHLAKQADVRFDAGGAWVTSYSFALSCPGVGNAETADQVSGFCGYYVDRL